MLKPNLVKPEDVRPARPDGTCFYCSKPLGDEHEIECVAFERTVIVEAHVTIPIEVPAFWSKEDIEFLHNESSSCADNILGRIDRVSELQDERERCMCPFVRVDYLREATQVDHENYGIV